MRRLKRIVSTILIGSLIMLGAIPALADLPYLTVTGDPVTAPTTPYITLTGLTGQSGCSISVSGSFGGNLTVEGFYKNGVNWSTGLKVWSPDGVSSVTSITTGGNYTFNCATMVSVRVNGSTATGTPSVTLNASQGANVLLGRNAGGGGSTTVVGTAPINVNTVGSTATVSLNTPLAIVYGGTNNSSLPTGCLQSDGTTVSSTGNPCAGATPPPTSVQAGTGISVATPSPGTFVVSNAGVLSVSGAGNIASTGGQNPTVSITAAPSFTNISTTSMNISGLTASNCVGTDASKNLVSNLSCVQSVSASGNLASSGGPTPNVTITNSPTFTGNVTAANLTDTSLTSGDCLKSVSGLIQSAGTSCPSGSLGGVTAGANIVVTTPNPNAPTVATTMSPTFTGTVVGGQLADSGLTASTCVGTDISKFLVSNNCVTGVIAGSNVVVGGSSTSPSVSLADPVTLHQYMAVLNTGGGYSTSGGPGGFGNTVGCTSACNQPVAYIWTTAAGPGVGAFIGGDNTKSVQGISDAYFQFGTITGTSPTIGAALDPTTGNMGFTGSVALGSTTASQCVATNGSKLLVSSGEQCPVSYQNNTRLGGNHFEGKNDVSVAGSSDSTFTFHTVYNAEPVCQATDSTTGGIIPAISINGAATISSVTIHNSSVSTHTYNVSCNGW